MKIKLIAGIVLAVLGIATLIHPGIPYTKKKEIMQVGPLRAEVETQEEYQVPPVAAGLTLAAGVVLLVWSRKK
ncbi:MAG TPA: hypothetical protein VNN18_10180 [Candidatus Xenobia bacterium]|nr:hypothetical protein [Candidatus Xenobia bacterium]